MMMLMMMFGMMLMLLHQVFSYTLSTMQLLREYEMPNPMSFKEEGGISLHPNGTKFIAVREVSFMPSMLFMS